MVRRVLVQGYPMFVNHKYCTGDIDSSLFGKEPGAIGFHISISYFVLLLICTKCVAIGSFGETSRDYKSF